MGLADPMANVYFMIDEANEKGQRKKRVILRFGGY